MNVDPRYWMIFLLVAALQEWKRCGFFATNYHNPNPALVGSMVGTLFSRLHSGTLFADGV